MQNRIFRKLCLVVLWLSPILAGAQVTVDTIVKDNSPFSRLGLGDLFNQNFAAITGMGGISAAYHDPVQINLQNPASLSRLKTTSFEAGLYAKYAQLSDGAQKAEVWSGNLAYLTLGFPTKNPINEELERTKSRWSWGMNLALLPYSNMSYGVKIISAVNDTTPVLNYFTGQGGTYKFFWGNGFRRKNLSFGLNLGYLFGKIANNRLLAVSDLVAGYQVVTKKEIGIGGFIWNAGVQYDFVFKRLNKEGKTVPDGRILTVGAYGNSATGFSTNSSFIEVRQNFRYAVEDTISNEEKVRESGKLPSEFAIGAIYQKENKWKIGFNIQTAQWENYENEAKPDILSNNYRISAGGEITPDFLSYNNYFKKIRYRAGVFYGKDERSSEALELKQYGLTLGFGFPITLPRQMVSFVNFGFEFGKFGPSDGLEETFGRLTLGLSLNDNSWFYKRKFN